MVIKVWTQYINKLNISEILNLNTLPVQSHDLSIREASYSCVCDSLSLSLHQQRSSDHESQKFQPSKRVKAFNELDFDT